MDTSAFSWTREPKDYVIGNDRIEITTAPHTDLWQRTYYHSATTTPRSCRWRPLSGISALW